MAEIPQTSFNGPLAPKFGLTDNARKSFPHDTVKISSGRNYTGLIPVAGIAIAILVLPLTVQLLNQQQDVRQRASGLEPTIPVPTQTVRPTATPTPTPIEQISTTPSPTIETEDKGNNFQL